MESDFRSIYTFRKLAMRTSGWCSFIKHDRTLIFDHVGIHLDQCRGFALGKNAKDSFPSSDNRSKGILDLVHFDVCGPMSIPSSSGYLYYVTFIDDYFRRTWILFMKTKDEVFNRFREFKA
jgi:hypothetical protein